MQTASLVGASVPALGQDSGTVVFHPQSQGTGLLVPFRASYRVPGMELISTYNHAHLNHLRWTNAPPKSQGKESMPLAGLCVSLPWLA